MKIYIIWLFGVILWNFGFPNAPPIADVIIAIILLWTWPTISELYKHGKFKVLRKIAIRNKKKGKVRKKKNKNK